MRYIIRAFDRHNENICFLPLNLIRSSHNRLTITVSVSWYVRFSEKMFLVPFWSLIPNWFNLQPSNLVPAFLRWQGAFLVQLSKELFNYIKVSKNRLMISFSPFGPLILNVKSLIPGNPPQSDLFGVEYYETIS